MNRGLLIRGVPRTLPRLSFLEIKWKTYLNTKLAQLSTFAQLIAIITSDIKRKKKLEQLNGAKIIGFGGRIIVKKIKTNEPPQVENTIMESLKMSLILK